MILILQSCNLHLIQRRKTARYGASLSGIHLDIFEAEGLDDLSKARFGVGLGLLQYPAAIQPRGGFFGEA